MNGNDIFYLDLRLVHAYWRFRLHVICIDSRNLVVHSYRILGHLLGFDHLSMFLKSMTKQA